VLQTPVAYSTKSNVTSAAITGATANNILGPAVNATDTGTTVKNNLTTGVDITSATALVTASNADTLTAGSSPANNSTITVDGKTITFSTAQTDVTSDSSGDVTIGVGAGSPATIQTVLSAIDGLSGATGSSVNGSGQLVINTGTTQALVLGGTALADFGLTAGTTPPTPPALQGESLTINATGGGTPTAITFGTGSGQISTLNQLNAALATNNLQATISTTGQITIVTSNDAAAATIGTIGGTAFTNAGAPFAGLAGAAPVQDPDSQATRANLVAQYNNVLNQINTTSQDSSFNGINLLNGDTLNLTFDETGASKLAITGVTFNDAGLGLSTLVPGTDFLDSNSADGVLTQLTAASTTLRSEASALGSNLSIVEIRQDFNKNLINVLQTGASNLTLADANEEAANSQALSTRQSIAVSALALANQSQQSVLQLLR
jgi:flagellin